MKLLIIEDEPAAASIIKETLDENYGSDHCVGLVSTIQDAIDMILKEDFSIIIFKLNLKGGSCFDILEKVSLKSFKSIFITDNPKEDEIISAVKFAPHDFLHNPLDPAELIRSIDSAIEKINTEISVKKIGLLLSLDEKTNKAKDRITFQLAKGSTIDVSISEILFLEADSSVTYLYLENDQKLSLPKNIGCYKDLLVTDFHFKSISKSILLNLKHLKSYNHKKLEINLQNGIKLNASRRGGKEFKEYLQEFQANDLSIVLNNQQ